MKILMVLTSHDRLGDTGRKTGFWLEEFAASVLCLPGLWCRTDAGFAKRRTAPDRFKKTSRRTKLPR